MAERHTVLILGAGASAPYGFPTGEELVDRIYAEFPAAALKAAAVEALRSQCRTVAKNFCVALRRSRRRTIDQFLESHPTLWTRGKEAIARVLLPCETENNLLRPDNDDDWYRELVTWLAPPGAIPDSPAHNVSIITFNYDRSLEQCLYLALNNAYEGMTKEKAVSFLQNLPIIHVHGSFGCLPWQPVGGRVLGYGGDGTTGVNDAVVKDLDLVFEEERIANGDALKAARQVLSSVTEIAFLGFGYDETNLRRLFVPEPFRQRPTQVKGTAFKMHEKDRQRKQALLNELLPFADVDLVAKTNRDFWSDTEWFHE